MKASSRAKGAPLVHSLFTATCDRAMPQLRRQSKACMPELHRKLEESCTWTVRCPSIRSALYRVMPGEPRASTAPRAREAGAIVNTESVDMLQESKPFEFAASRRKAV